MKNERDDFDDAYWRSPEYFGRGPEKVLVEHVDLVEWARPALDVGVGQGRNAVFLAENGVTVHAIDPSAEAVRMTAELARDNKLPIVARQTDFQAFDPHSLGPDFTSYSAVCLFGLVPLLEWADISRLRDRVASWSGRGTVVFFTAFTTQDPVFEKCSRTWIAMGRNSFRGPEGDVRTFLEPGEAASLYPDLTVVHEWEGMGPEHRHGDGQLQRHGMVELVLQR